MVEYAGLCTIKRFNNDEGIDGIPVKLFWKYRFTMPTVKYFAGISEANYKTFSPIDKLCIKIHSNKCICIYVSGNA